MQPLDQRPPVNPVLYKPSPPIQSEPFDFQPSLENFNRNYHPLIAPIYERDPNTLMPIHCIPDGCEYTLTDTHKKHCTIRVGKNARLNLGNSCFKLVIIGEEDSVVAIGKNCISLTINGSSVLKPYPTHNLIINGVPFADDPRV